MTESENIIFEDSCYVFTESNKTWTENRKTCVDKGGDLVTMETEKEWQFINKEIQKRVTPTAWYIGLTNMGQEWKWVSGRPLTIGKWQDEEPNGDGHVVEIAKEYRPNEQGLFNDVPEFWRRASICEIIKGNAIRDREDD